jgi:hypothetical protein
VHVLIGLGSVLLVALCSWAVCRVTGCVMRRRVLWCLLAAGMFSFAILFQDRWGAECLMIMSIILAGVAIGAR